MFCPHCGQPVAEAATFCGSCGKPLVEGVHVERAGYHAGRELATFWPRLGALLVDQIVIILAVVIFGIPTFGIGLAMSGDEEPTGAAAALTILGATGIVMIAVGLAWTFSARGRSPGLGVAGLRVVDKAGNPPGVSRGLARLLVAVFLSSQILYLGYLWSIWDREKRTWHDHLAGTWVVKDE